VSEQAAVRSEVVARNILIVDDESEVRRFCADVAAQTGLKPFAVSTAEEAAECLEQSAVDILLARRHSLSRFCLRLAMVDSEQLPGSVQHVIRAAASRPLPYSY
jgi:hypothetical protein